MVLYKSRQDVISSRPFPQKAGSGGAAEQYGMEGKAAASCPSGSHGGSVRPLLTMNADC